MVRIANSAAELRKAIAEAGAAPRVVLEAAYGWCWAADVLARSAPRCTSRIRWGEGVQLPPGQETTRKTPLTWPTCCGRAGCLP
jgi:hypothetical protein